MPTKNLFIVNTPFHLLTAFILSHSLFKEADNYMALIHPHGYDQWKDNPVLNYMSSVSCGYKAVYPLGYCWSSRQKNITYRQQTLAVQETIGRLGIDDVFLGSDIDVQNQLLTAAIGKTRFYRYEDGLYSYYNENRRRRWADMMFHKLKIKWMEKIAGIHSDLCINTSTASASKAGCGDFMYYPHLLQRYSPDVQEISREMIAEGLHHLKEKGFLQPEFERETILYLSQPLVEQKKITLAEEFSVLKQIAAAIGPQCQLLYKPHPNDSPHKLDFYRRELSAMRRYTSVKPVELVFASEKKLQTVISYQSTALLTAGKFSIRTPQVISLAGFYKEPLPAAYIQILRGAGVEFPANVETLLRMLPATVKEEK